MVNVSVRVKKALFERGWTQKKLCGEIDISENGFKRMAENNTWKLETLEKMANALDLPVAYFVTENEQNNVEPKYLIESNYLRETLEKLHADIAKLSTVLMTKDQQIDKLLDLLGKPEGAIDEPLSTYALTIFDMLDQYKTLALGQVTPPVQKANKRGSKVGGTPFSYAESTVIIK